MTVQKEDPADPTGILGYEPADPGYWGSCQLILPGYWGTTSQLRSVGPLIRRGPCSSRRVSLVRCCVLLGLMSLLQWDRIPLFSVAVAYLLCDLF